MNSAIGQSKKSLNQDLSHLPFVPQNQQQQMMKNLEEPLAIQGQQTSSVLNRNKAMHVQGSFKQQTINIGLSGGKGVPYPKTGMFASVGTETGVLKTLVVGKLQGEGDRDSMRASQGRVQLNKKLSLIDRAESAI